MSFWPSYPTTITIREREQRSSWLKVRLIMGTPFTFTMHFVLFCVSCFRRFPIPAARIIACIVFVLLRYIRLPLPGR